jgi:hypothetical protein
MKTAVEFLIKELQLDVFANDEEMATIIKAKEMEKGQIENAFENGMHAVNIHNLEQYYNETFKQQEQ